MRSNLLKLFVFSIGLLFFNSCIVKKHYVNQVVKKENVENLKLKTIVVTASDNVDLKDFKKTYKKNYSDNKVFAKSYLDDASLALKMNGIFSNVKVGDINDWDSLRESSNSDYIIDFPYFEINNRVEITHNSSAVGMQTSSTEYCVINVKVVVYDVKKKKRIIEFLSTGESSVFLFDFTKTFQSAKERSITHIVNYLKSGKTEYTKY